MVDHLQQLDRTSDRLPVIAVGRRTFYRVVGHKAGPNLNKPYTIKRTVKHTGKATFLLPGQLLLGGCDA